MCVRFVCGGGLYKNGGEAMVLLIWYGFGLWYTHKERTGREEREKTDGQNFNWLVSKCF